MENQRQTRKLLSLDGGGIRGMSTIAILKELMKKLAYKRNVEVIHPWQEFDMIGGTSTDGLLAIMLGRLRMSIDQCEKAYAKFSQDIFTPRSSTAFGRTRDLINARGRFSTEALETYIKELIDVAGLPQSAKLEDRRSDSPKTFVSVVRQENGANTVIRSYQNHYVYNHLEDCKIWEAARATSAASTFFDPISIGENQETYVDGALGFNNPIRLLDRESRDIWPNDDRVFLSIGTGQASDVNLEGNLFDLASRLKEMVVETEKTAQGFEMDHPDLLENNRYFRFTVKEGLRDVGLEEFKARAKIHAATSTYLETADVMIRVRHFVSAISPDISNFAAGIGNSTPGPYLMYHPSNTSNTYSPAGRPPYPTYPAHSIDYGAQEISTMGYPARNISIPNHSNSYGAQMQPPRTAAPYSLTAYPATMPTSSDQQVMRPVNTTSYGSTMYSALDSSNSNSPQVQPHGVAPSNPDAGRTLTFKEQLQARKDRENLNKNLMQAVMRNNPASVEMLLQQGADVNAFCKVLVSGGERSVPPIYVAAHKKHNDVLRVLLQHDPDANAVGDDTCGNALLAAIQAGNEEGVEELLGAGADPNKSGSSYKGTPLMVAALINASGILKLLILAKADVNAQSTTPGWGPTALDTAAASMNSKCVRALVNAGANVNSLANEKHFKFVQYCLAH